MESALHDLELTILDMATRIVLITTAEIPSIKNSKLFFDVANALEYPSEKIVLVVNESDQRGGIRVVDIEQSIRHPVACAIPVEERVASTAVNQGVPLGAYTSKQHHGATDQRSGTTTIDRSGAGRKAGARRHRGKEPEFAE